MADDEIPDPADIEPADIPGVKKPNTKSEKYAAKRLAEVAEEVAAGKWGVGRERDNLLIAAGWTPVHVRAEINRQRRAAKIAERTG